MTTGDIIRMAREAGFADGVAEIVGLEGFANFANLVATRAAALEREACAKLCDEARAARLAEQIRARGELK